MELTKEELQELLALKTLPDSDDIRVKEKIKRKLLDNRKLIYILNNKQLQESEAEADDYYGVNIFPAYLIHPTQYDVQNFVCFTVGYRDLARYNKSIRQLQIVFVILCEEKNLIEKHTGIARHDLLAHLILDQFNHTNIFGQIVECVRDEESVVDNDYACRTLVFEQTTDNGLVKTSNGSSGYARLNVVR